MSALIPTRTADGSLTLFVPGLNEHYHSTHGARQESAHVFIAHGLAPLLRAAAGSGPASGLNVLEIGLGTGLNAVLTLEAARHARAAVSYAALETVPLAPDVVAALATAYDSSETRPVTAGDAAPPPTGELFRRLHAAPWGTRVMLSAGFDLTKWPRALETLGPAEAPLTPQTYQLIYFDAFAPQKQPELWTAAIFRQLYAAAVPGGVLVTYCAQGQFRRDLRAAGWRVEKLPGPPGKREMTRATKPGARPAAAP